MVQYDTDAVSTVLKIVVVITNFDGEKPAKFSSRVFSHGSETLMSPYSTPTANCFAVTIKTILLQNHTPSRLAERATAMNRNMNGEG